MSKPTPKWTDFKTGDRVRLTDTKEAFPHFLLEGNPVTGPTGTVTDSHDESVWGKMDEHVPGIEDWDNEIQFAHQYGDPITLKHIDTKEETPCE